MKNLNRVHLGGLRAIEAVNRLGTLRAAAGEMGVTIGAVSQKVRKAERQLGHVLFERRPKGLTPTRMGEELARHLSHAMAELSAAVALAERSGEDTLTVSVAPVLAEKWLVWRLKAFNDAHPDLRIRVDATLSLVDPNVSDVDVCIRVGKGNWPGVRAVELLKHLVFPVCSPAVAQSLRTPEDLAQVPIIRDWGAMFDWDVWLDHTGLDKSILGGGPTFSDASLCLDAAIAGQGVFLAWETLACDALNRGRVAAPFPGRYPTGISYWFVTGHHARRTPSTRKFEAWLRGELAAYG
jgi:LysR family glycine cleavage system transcriptional activator